MNIYHIAYAPAVKTAHLHFWGCNLSCRACLLVKEIYDCHLEETKGGIFAKEKKTTMEIYWVPGVNNLKQYGRWAFAEFTDVFQIEAEFNKLIDSVTTQPAI